MQRYIRPRTHPGRPAFVFLDGDDAEVGRVANDTTFGLSCSVFSGDRERAIAPIAW